MNNNLLNLLAALSVLSACAAETKSVITYHLDANGKRIDSEYVDEKYFVNRKTNLKQGKYVQYGKQMMLIKEGNYVNGVKTGEWKSWHDTDHLWLVTNYDTDSIPRAMINKNWLRYPTILMEQLEVLPSGIMKVGYTVSDDCDLLKAEIVQGVHPLLDSIILSKFVEYFRLKKKYKQPIEECGKPMDSEIIINFMAER